MNFFDLLLRCFGTLYLLRLTILIIRYALFFHGEIYAGRPVPWTKIPPPHFLDIFTTGPFPGPTYKPDD